MKFKYDTGEVERAIRAAFVQRARRNRTLISTTLQDLKDSGQGRVVAHVPHGKEPPGLHFCILGESIVRMGKSESGGGGGGGGEGLYTPPELDDLQKMSLLHITVLAASFLATCITAAGSDDLDELPGFLNPKDLDLITAVLEKQPLSTIPGSEVFLQPTQFRYRIVIFQRFDRALQKSSSVDSGLGRDTMDFETGSGRREARPLVKGPYATSIDVAIQAFHAEIDEKALAIFRDPDLVDDGLWVIRPLRKAAEECHGEERSVPGETWVGANVWPMTLAHGEATEAEMKAEKTSREGPGLGWARLLYE